MKWLVVALLVSGIAAAFCAALLVASLGIGQGKGGKDSDQPKEVKILVVHTDVTAPRVVTADMFEEKKIMSDKSPAGAIDDSVKAIGEVLTSDVKAGEALSRKHFAPEGTGRDLAARLPDGYRLMTVSLSNYASLEGLLYPGSFVDVIATFSLHGQGSESKAMASTLVEKVEVYDVAGDAVRAQEEPAKPTEAVKNAVAPKEEKKAASGSSRSVRKVTFKVDSHQAKALQLAIEYGTITLVMRNPADQKAVADEAMVLNEGELAKLSEFLRANVEPRADEPAPRSDGTVPVATQPTTAAPVPGVLADPVFDPATPEWQVKVFRGVKEPETVTFPAPAPAGR